MKPGLTHDIDQIQSDPWSWLPHWPSPADFRFDYFTLMVKARHGLAHLQPGELKSLAIVGAGAAGMVIAREAHRAGFQVTIFEASERIGGRLFTLPNPTGDDQTGMELGAMRMPFFTAPGENNSLLDYFLRHEPGPAHEALVTPFPNPGIAAGGTGVYIGSGQPEGRYNTKARTAYWSMNGDKDDLLTVLAQKVSKVNNFFCASLRETYLRQSVEWPTLWQKVVDHYDAMSFDDLLRAPQASKHDGSGNLGGYGMDDREAGLLYTIGTGDGGWGAFANISALWFLRCTVFGFLSKLQSVEGLGHPDALPHYRSEVVDTSGRRLCSPLYEGIQSLVEYLFYCRAPGEAQSLYEAARLYTAHPVSRITRVEGGVIVTHGPERSETRFDYIAVTASKWSSQTAITFDNFDPSALPHKISSAAYGQHNIASSKVFFPLIRRYWEQAEPHIPQVLVTDTLIQDVYGLSWRTKSNDRGVLLASYTWEDDSLKLLPFDSEALTALIRTTLRSITVSQLGQDITEHIDFSHGVCWHWIEQPSFVGCSKLYRPYNEARNRLDLSYNEALACDSCVYFAGESYGVEGGWLEPALRNAVDAVIRLLDDAGAVFQVPGFDMSGDYPSWLLQ